MYINGEPVDDSVSDDEIIERIRKLRSFPPERDYMDEAVRGAVPTVRFKELAQIDPQAAVNFLIGIVKKPFAALPNPKVHVLNLMNASEALQSMVMKDLTLLPQGLILALEAYEKALALSEAVGFTDGVLQASGNLYLLASEMMPEGADIVGSEISSRYIKMLPELMRKNLDAYLHLTPAPENADAYYVGQREVGYSAEEPLGTDNLRSCIALIVQDSKTQKTVLAHIDNAATTESIDAVFARLPSASSAPLRVRLVGGAFTEDSSPDNEYWKAGIILRNILPVLRKHNVDIVSADILETNQPTCIVYYPKSHKLRFETPLRTPDTILANARPLLATDEQLNVRFDLTCCKEYAPITVSKNMIEFIKIVKKRYGDASNIGSDSHLGTSPVVPTVMAHHNQCAVAYESAVAGMRYAMTRKADKIKAAGGKLDDKTVNQVHKLLGGTPLCIGPNAALGNKPLLDLIEDKLFTFPEKGGKKGKWGVDLKLLESYEPGEPIDLLIAAKGTGFQAKIVNSSGDRSVGGVTGHKK